MYIYKHVFHSAQVQRTVALPFGWHEHKKGEHVFNSTIEWTLVNKVCTNCLGNSSVTDITIQRFLETWGAHFIYLQVLNLKSFTAIAKQSSWIVHPMKLRSIVWISYEILYIMTAVTDITSFGSHILHTNTFVEKSVSLWIQQRHFHYWIIDKVM